MTCAPVEVDATPPEGVLRIMRGDPFGFRLILHGLDGAPVDVSLWQWAGTVVDGNRLRLDFEWQADDTGVNLWMRGDATARLSVLRPGRFDISCMAPTAGEGSTVFRGEVHVTPRVGNPLRNDPDAAPRDEVPA